MPNLYGVANPINSGGVAYTAGIANVNCPAGVTTAIFTFNLNSGFPGMYFPVLWLAFDIVMGGTPPTALVTAFSINGGSAVMSIGTAPAYLVAGATYRETSTLMGTPSYNFWNAAVSPVVTVTVNPTAQAVTVLGPSSSVAAQLFRGPD